MSDHFCNCPAINCPHHPRSHDDGCDPCIQKNLRQNEIPSCFFIKVNPDVEDIRDFSIDGFVDFYTKHKKEHGA